MLLEFAPLFVKKKKKKQLIQLLTLMQDLGVKVKPYSSTTKS